MTALIASVAPALLLLRQDLVSPLRRGAPSIAGGSSAPGRRTLVVAQVALAVTVLAAAGVLIRSVLNLQAVELGLPADRLVLLDLHLPSARYAERPQRSQFLDEAISQLQAVPAIAAATPVNVAEQRRNAHGEGCYRVEPFAVAADVYAHPMHVGRGGWTWYSGSAGWMYQAAIRALLGLRRQGATISVEPCIPTVWPAYSLDWTLGRTRYRITVSNPGHQSRGIASATLDGFAVDPRAIPLLEDGSEHEVAIVLGAAPSADVPLATPRVTNA